MLSLIILSTQKGLYVINMTNLVSNYFNSLAIDIGIIPTIAIFTLAFKFLLLPIYITRSRNTYLKKKLRTNLIV